MSRRSAADRRPVTPDPRFGSTTVTKFINSLMVDGKKSLAERIFYDAIDILGTRAGQPGVQVFERALSNAKPALEVRSRRVGGATYQVPIEVRPERRSALAIRWLIGFARARAEKNMSQRLGRRAACGEQGRGKHRQEEGGHSSDGRGEQGFRPLSLVGHPKGRRPKTGSVSPDN